MTEVGRGVARPECCVSATGKWFGARDAFKSPWLRSYIRMECYNVTKRGLVPAGAARVQCLSWKFIHVLTVRHTRLWQTHGHNSGYIRVAGCTSVCSSICLYTIDNVRYMTASSSVPGA